MPERRLQVFETDQIRVTFDPNVCIYSGVCLRTLPVVFDARQQRWIQPENATADAVIATVARCPSGALRAELVTAVMPRGTPRDAPPKTGVRE